MVAGVIAVGLSGGASAQAEDLSDKTVGWLMDAAFGMMPDKFTTAEKKVIVVDRSKPDDYKIPVADARDVVKVGWNSARAQVCKLLDKQRENYQALVKHTEEAKKWSDKQMLYIRQLHLFVVQFGTGSVKIVQDGEDQKAEQVTPEEISPVKPCSDDEKKALIERIDAYVQGKTAG